MEKNVVLRSAGDIFYDENGVKWTIGLPLRGPINGPFIRIVQPH